MSRKNKWYLKEFRAKYKAVRKLMPPRDGLPSNLEMQNWEIGRAEMAYDILRMLEKDGVIDIGYIQDVISEWDPELWTD
jgi:hypothetical protein